MSIESQTATFLFTDIEGSTRLWEREPERMQPAMRRHDQLCQDMVARHRGRVIKGTGDGIHAVFEDAVDAVLALVDLQLAFEQPLVPGGLTLRLRAGLHCGPSEARGGDYFGSVVNRAARVMGVAHGGQSLVTQAVVDLVADRLPADVTLLELGSVRLRDLAHPERVYQVQHPSLRAHFPALRSLEATPNNLSQQLNSFVGRERELREIRELLKATRLLTLLGMGGIGKSRLSVQLGAELMDEYPDGVWLVELAPLADAQLVPQAVANVLGVKEEAGNTVTTALLAYVRDKKLLLILDNCEHVVQACADLSKQILQAGPHVKLLTSSREILQLAGEAVYQVPTLGVPATVARGDVDPNQLAQHEAVRLFLDRATAIQGNFRLRADNAAAVANICRQLDGIPLALELAAARTRVLSVQAIADRLADRFKLLVTGDKTVLPRQRTLRALIDWSFDLLSEPERTLFRRLSVFAGGWTLEAAEAVGAGEGIDAGDVLDLLAHLIDKSLVVMEPDGTRYRMLETVRTYAAERMEISGEADVVKSRHVDQYLQLAETARPYLAGPEQDQWRAKLDLERENLLAARRVLSLGNDDSSALRLVHALRPYWVNRGELSLGLGMALDVLARPGLKARNTDRCMALFSAGQLSFLMGRHDDAHEYLDECLNIAEENDADAIVARVLQPLGMNALARGDLDTAETHLTKAVECAKVLGEKREMAYALNALAMLYRLRGSTELAYITCAQALAVLRDLSDVENIGIVLVSIGMVLMQLGRVEEADAALRELHGIAKKIESLPVQVGALELACGLATTREQWFVAANLRGAAQKLRETAALRRDPADDEFVLHAANLTELALGNSSAADYYRLGRQLANSELTPLIEQVVGSTMLSRPTS